ELAYFYVEKHPKGVEIKTVGVAIRDFNAFQKPRNLSQKHKSTLTTHTKAFASSFDDTPINKITGNILLDWLYELYKSNEPRTVENYRSSLSNFFGWCKRRGLIKEDPTKFISKSDLPPDLKKPRDVLTIDQAEAMMAYLDEHEPKYARWHAIRLFAGIRESEVFRLRNDLDWIDTTAKTLTLPASKEGEDGKIQRIVKTGDDWVLHDLPDNLWLWLSKYENEGPIAVPGSKVTRRHRQDKFPRLSSPIDPWPQNAMRHTFCTMMLSLHGDAVKVCNWSRHSNPRMLYQSYVAKLVSKSEAARFFSIRPT
ncbi:MAG: hypothetical protein AAF558_14730, partial [Verrucomicrobiota bacterium]